MATGCSSQGEGGDGVTLHRSRLRGPAPAPQRQGTRGPPHGCAGILYSALQRAGRATCEAEGPRGPQGRWGAMPGERHVQGEEQEEAWEGSAPALVFMGMRV